MKRESWVQLIAAIIGVLAVVLGVWLHQTGYFTTADVTFVRSYDDEVCPSLLDANSKDFSITFSNENGNREAVLTAELNSPNNISFIKRKDSVNIPAGKLATLNFIINNSSIKKERDSYTDNVLIEITGVYDANSRGNYKKIPYNCTYVGGNNLILVRYVSG